MTKIILLGLIFLSISSIAQGNNKFDLIDYRLERIDYKLNSLPNKTKYNIYSNLIIQVESFKSKIGNNYGYEYLLYMLDFFIDKKLNLTGDISYTTTLRLDDDIDFNLSVINNNKNEIKTSKTLFLFRHTKNLSSKVIKDSLTAISDINPDLKIFIDQEGGLIKRYIDFDYFDLKSYLDDEYVSSRYKEFGKSDKKIFDELFSKNYFPSLGDIGKSYRQLNSNKKNFLDIVSYIRFKNLSQIGINTYGLVLDLDYGNPVISDLSRSFGSDLGEYKKLIDFYVLNANRFGISLYAKHFPGHGSGDIDTHDDILVFDTQDIEYLNKNIRLFDYFIESQTTKDIGFMVGHFYIPNTLKQDYYRVLDKAGYIITDDLSMQGYQKAIENQLDGKFFTTINLSKFPNLYKLDLQRNINITD